MKITEKWLLDNLTGISNSGDFISEKIGYIYYWGYGAGEGDNYKRVTFRDDADSIRVIDKAENIFSIPLPKFAHNKKMNIKAQKMIREWAEQNREDFVTYETLLLFNRYLLDVSDHPKASKSVMESILKGKKPSLSRFGASAYNDTMGFYRQYLKNKDKIPVEALKAIMGLSTDSKYTKIYGTMQKLFDEQQNAPESFLDSLCTMTNMSKDIIKKDLHCIYDECRC